MAEGQFLNAHILQALALEGAEGFAELLHQQLRQMWGFGDPAENIAQDLFRTQYRGRRYDCLSSGSQVRKWRIYPDPSHRHPRAG